ncbi:MAG: hypothetical protein Q8R32_03550 [bacterium]|nr:hypothetical protein [bacterium]
MHPQNLQPSVQNSPASLRGGPTSQTVRTSAQNAGSFAATSSEGVGEAVGKGGAAAAAVGDASGKPESGENVGTIP